MSRIKTVTIDQKLEIRKLPLISSGDIGTDFFEVRFDSLWQLPNVTYYALFYKTTPQNGTAVELTETDGVYSCMIPSEMLAAAGRFFFAVYAKNEQGNIVKTSTERPVDVRQGAFTGAAIAVDWNTFKPALINELNNRFQLELAGDISNEDILSAIGTLEDGKARTEFFIELLNAAVSLVNAQLLEADAPLPLLSANMEDSEIESIISDDFDLIVKIFGFYTSTMAATAQLHHEIFEESEIWETIEHNISTDIADIRAYLRSLKTRLENFRGNVIDVLPEDSITLDSSDSDIVTAITNTLDTLRAEVEASAGVERMIINSLYSLYTGGN